MRLKQAIRPFRSVPNQNVRTDRSETGETLLAEPVWDQGEWSRRESSVTSRIVRSADDSDGRLLASRWGRTILRSYSSSFFAVTRFLPQAKRADVEIVYGAVRYPDEVVDTFDLPDTAKIRILEDWRDRYEDSDSFAGVKDAVAAGIPVVLAGFRDVARRNDIPDSYYASFLRAMRTDVVPRSFESWDDLIEGYVYGSATVVGYFLAHIYGAAEGYSLSEAKASARALAVGLQLTNFARDVADDSARRRCYLPADVVDESGRPLLEPVLAGDREAITQAQLSLAREARRWYDEAMPGICAFNLDSRLAIEACHHLYSRLNDKILAKRDGEARTSLSYREKLSVLPRNKYWRLPIAMVFER